MTKSKKKPVPRRSAVDPILRDPFYTYCLPDFFEFVLKEQTISQTLVRNGLAVVLLISIGLRISDVHPLKHRQIKEFIENQGSTVFSKKTQKMQVKVISYDESEKLNLIYEAYLDILRSDGYTVNPNDFIFVSAVNPSEWANKESLLCLNLIYEAYLDILRSDGYTVNPNDFIFVSAVNPSEWANKESLLCLTHFMTTVNNLLDKFGTHYSAIIGEPRYFPIHSGRIGIITSATRAGIPIDITADIIGHANSEVTRKCYNQYVRSKQEKKDIINEVSKYNLKQGRPRKEPPPDSTNLGEGGETLALQLNLCFARVRRAS